MRGRRPGALRPGDFFRTLSRKIPELQRLANVDFELFSNVDSSEMQPEMWSDLAALLARRMPKYDGCVVTHGTDTMPETAAALSFMLVNPPCPIVLTGAQRPLGEIRTDARINLIDAVTSAIFGPKEVSVCFDSHLYRGNRVRKVSVGEYDAFQSPNCPHLGVLGVDARFNDGRKPRGRFALQNKLDPRVFLLRVFPGLHAPTAIALLDQVHGIVLEAYGAGTFPVRADGDRSLVPFFEAARRRHIPLLVISQVPRYGVDLPMYAAGARALELGVISGLDMTPAAALAKLMHGLAYYRGRALTSYLTRSIAGELSAIRPRTLTQKPPLPHAPLRVAVRKARSSRPTR